MKIKKSDDNKSSIIVPDKPCTDTIAHIRITRSSVYINFQEKKEDFNSIAKQLFFYWEGAVWKRDITHLTGTAFDRAAEIGHVLLRQGFTVKVDDMAVANCAVAGLFESECTRWIDKRDGGKFDGWFAIIWRDKNEVLYDASRRLPGSRWSSPDVVVPAEEYEEALGFAQIHGFKLTPEAKFLCRYGKIQKYSMLKARPIEQLDFSTDEFNEFSR